MSRKNVLTPYQIFTSGSMASTNTLTSADIDVSYLDNVAIQVVWTGTPNGSFDVKGSVDSTTFTSLGIADLDVSGAAGNHLINLNNVPFKKLRVTYTNTSSTGTLNGYVMAKEV